MRPIRRTTLLAVAILIAVISLVATTTDSAQAHENIGMDPGLTVTVTETDEGTVLTFASVDPGVTLTVTFEDDEDDDVDLDVISKDSGVKVKVKKTDDGVTLTATSEDGTASLEVIATADSVTWARCTPGYMGVGSWG